MSFKKVTKVIALFSFVVLVAASVAMAADKPVLTVGTFTSTKRSTESHGHDDRRQPDDGGPCCLRSRHFRREWTWSTRWLTHSSRRRPGVRDLKHAPTSHSVIKWQTMQIPMGGYFEQNASKWDMSEKGRNRNYVTHIKRSSIRNRAHTRHILSQTEGDALNAALEVYKTKDFAKVAPEYSRDPNSAKNGGDLGWVEKGMDGRTCGSRDEGASVGSLVGPVKSDYGWHIIEVTERRPGKQLSFEESAERAVQGLQKQYLENELKELQAKFSVNIDEEALKNLGGVPAPAAAK